MFHRITTCFFLRTNALVWPILLAKTGCVDPNCLVPKKTVWSPNMDNILEGLRFHGPKIWTKSFGTDTIKQPLSCIMAVVFGYFDELCLLGWSWNTKPSHPDLPKNPEPGSSHAFVTANAHPSAQSSRGWNSQVPFRVFGKNFQGVFFGPLFFFVNEKSLREKKWGKNRDSNAIPLLLN